MATEANGSEVRRFVPAVLPWIVGAVAFLVYAVTLNHWVSFYGLGTLARVAGWTSQPVVLYPLTSIALGPFGLLPESWIPRALNLFTATCAALVLVLLARTIALLMHNPAQAGGIPQGNQPATLTPRAAWVAPVLAAAACGLQSTFWEHATSATGEMMDLLLFAYIIRCLLEFRNDRKESWLARSAFLYGAGLTDNWALWLYLPLFVIAVVRLRCIRRLEIGYTILNLRSLLRLGLWGLAGLSLYLLLPAFSSLSSLRHAGFWAALKTNLKFEKDAVHYFLHPGLGLLALATYLPLLAISFRWDFGPSRSAKDNLSLWITHATIHVVHAVLLLASLWLMLDPPFSPHSLGYGVEPVGQYYISALVIGYCAGHFLIIGSQLLAGPSDSYAAGPGRQSRRLGKLIVPAMFTLLVAVPVALVSRNLSQIRVTNGPTFREFASRLYDALPSGKSVVLSDDAKELYLVRTEVGAHRHGKAPLLLDTRGLALEQYQRFMARQFKARWPVVAGTNSHEEPKLLNPLALLSQFPTNEPMVYLHPGFDYCFEQFVERPYGPIHFLLERPTPEAIQRSLDERTAAASEQYWQQQWTNSLHSLARHAGSPPPPWAARLFAALHLRPEPNPIVSYLGAEYARSLNYLGVQMQKLGRWKEAGLWFQRALELNSGNLSAQINLEYNQRHQRGDTARLSREEVETRFSDLFGKHRSWERSARDNGPIDEPTFLTATATFLGVEANFHQAAGEFLRCIELAPDWLEPKLGLAETYIALGYFAGSLRLAEKLGGANPPLAGLDEARLVSCRARALRGLDREKEAVSCIESYVRQHQEQPEVLLTAMQLYLQFKQYVLALALLDQLLTLQPEIAEFLQSKGLAHLGLEQYEAAIAAFTAVLDRDPSNPAARINRAIACLGAAGVAPTDQLLQLNQYVKPLALLDQLLTLQPENADLLQSKGLAHMGLKQYEAAIAPFTRVLDRDPSNPAARINRAIACLGAARVDPTNSVSAGRLDEAHADCQEVLKHFPRVHQVLYGLAEIAWLKKETNSVSAGRLDEARADYLELLPRFPNAPQIAYGLGEIAWRKHDAKAAIEFYQRYLASGNPQLDEYKQVSDRVKQLQTK